MAFSEVDFSVWWPCLLFCNLKPLFKRNEDISKCLHDKILTNFWNHFGSSDRHFERGEGPGGPSLKKSHFFDHCPGQMETQVNASLEMSTCVQTYDGWRKGLANARKFNAISKKAISVQPCTCVRT